jgi:hypothetical protein
MELKNNKYLHTIRENEKDRINIEIGDTKQTDFYPQLKILRWDNEVNFSIRLDEDYSDFSKDNIVNDNDVIKWDREKKQARIYQIDNENTEFDVILSEKPSSNVIGFTIKTKGLDFFYQPELSDEEKETCYRPDNVIGSYAVYHKEKFGNYTDKEYRTGKFGHIYRPKIIDNNNNWTWADINIDVINEYLSIVIPQKFLDEATYPIIIDPTFGSGSTGATTHSSISTNTALLAKGTPVSSGDVDSLTGYFSVLFSSTNLKGVIWLYSDLSIVANGVDGIITVNSSSKLSYSSNYITKPSVSSGVSYYVGYIATTNSPSAYYDTGSAGDGGNDVNSYSTPTALGTGTPISNTNRIYAIYATYTTTSSSAIKTINGLAKASVKTVNGLAIASVKTWNGLS